MNIIADLDGFTQKMLIDNICACFGYFDGESEKRMASHSEQASTRDPPTPEVSQKYRNVKLQASSRFDRIGAQINGFT